MPHITVIINRAPPATAEEQDGVSAAVSYTPAHDATPEQVAQDVKRIYKQVKNLGSEGTSD
jgi:hypothetical protein